MADRLAYSFSPRSTFGTRGALAASAMVETHGGEGLEWFVLGENGDELGPFNFRVVRAKLRIGVFSSDVLVWREGMRDWAPARDQHLFASCIDYTPLQTDDDDGDAAAARDGTVKKELRFNLSSSGVGGSADRRNGGYSSRRTPPLPSASSSGGGGGDAAPWYFINGRREEEGPCTRDELELMLMLGEDVDETTWVWSYGAQPEWTRAKDAPALKTAVARAARAKETAAAKTPSTMQQGTRREFMTRDALEEEESDDGDDNMDEKTANGTHENGSNGSDAFTPSAKKQSSRGYGRAGSVLPKRFESLPSALTAAAVARDAHLPPPPPPGHTITSSPLRSPIEDAARLSSEAAALRTSVDGKEAKCKKYKAKIKAMGDEMGAKDKQIAILEKMVAEARQREKQAASTARRLPATSSALDTDGSNADIRRRYDDSKTLSVTPGSAAGGIDLAAVNDTLEAQRDEIARLRASLSERDAELARVRESFSTNLSWFLNGVEDGETIDLMRHDSLLLNALKSVKDDE